MINEERVRELYHIAKYDMTQGTKNSQMGHFYRSDYIWKELIKSFFTGTISFAIIVILIGIYYAKSIIKAFSSFDLEHISIIMVIMYVIFMIVYFLITYVVYYHRYTIGRRNLKELYEHVKRANKLYEDEEINN
ncbi:hypothetical protein [Lachnobacterium bovis]|uniref:Uncharacterized protein n=1 Tax=Lachnobacterium bovis TaxID=140626 RepID=A0A1H9P039_9FIRM|nr:hypothetical protein [Lachnobacterium bovis]SER41644.1 hypothetical protein SAMN02910429_00033 [Lachnobacterium bovis]